MSTDDLAAQQPHPVDVVVIGAGQAGLSAAYYLRKFGIEPESGFVVLDHASGPGGAWQFRWPSLTLSTVNGVHDLPGMSFAETTGTDAEQVPASVAVPTTSNCTKSNSNFPSTARYTREWCVRGKSACGSRPTGEYSRREA